MRKKITSFYLNPTLLDEFRQQCRREGRTMTAKVESFMRSCLHPEPETDRLDELAKKLEGIDGMNADQCKIVMKDIREIYQTALEPDVRKKLEGFAKAVRSRYDTLNK